MTRFPAVLLASAMFCLCQRVASAQAMVENALGAGRAATSAAPMSGLGKSISGVTEKLGKTLEKEASTTPAVSTTPARRTTAARPPVPVKTAAATPAPAKPEVRYDDPKHIESGIPYDELVRRFGPATLEITTSSTDKTLSYVSRAGTVDVEVREGTVVSAKIVQ